MDNNNNNNLTTYGAIASVATCAISVIGFLLKSK